MGDSRGLHGEGRRLGFEFRSPYAIFCEFFYGVFGFSFD